MKQILFSVAAIAITSAVHAQTKIYEFRFDNAYTATVGTGAFIANDSTSFTTDRHGNVKGAIQIKNQQTEATLSGLPEGTNSRSISLWVKLNAFNANVGELNFLYAYGDASPDQADIALIRPTEVWHSGYDNEHKESTNHIIDTWYHYVFTYNGSSSQIYRDGILLGSSSRTWNTDAGSGFFSLGSGLAGSEAWFDGAIDDLHIYDYVLTATEVAALYNPTTSIHDVNNAIVSIYPNPAKDVLNIEVKEKSQIKIVNLLSAPLATQYLYTGNNTIDVSHLPKGVYFIQTENGSGMKFIKE